MICHKCIEDFPEKEVQLSHDIPCYLFIFSGDRKRRKNQADKHGRHWLCKKCHEEYERSLNNFLKLRAKLFAREWFDG
jgi:hypothetical protein